MNKQSKLLINEYPLQVLPSLANTIGLNEAIILQQIHYWLNNSQHDYEGRKWIYNSIPQWHKQFPFWSESTIKRTLKKLEDLQLIETGNFNTLKIDRTKWYTINYQTFDTLEVTDHQVNLTQSEDQYDNSHEVNMTPPLPETTTEITTETNNQGNDLDDKVSGLKNMAGSTPKEVGVDPTPTPPPENGTLKDMVDYFHESVTNKIGGGFLGGEAQRYFRSIIIDLEIEPEMIKYKIGQMMASNDKKVESGQGKIKVPFSYLKKMLDACISQNVFTLKDAQINDGTYERSPEESLAVPQGDPCPKCKGDGKVEREGSDRLHRCLDCSGSGVIQPLKGDYEKWREQAGDPNPRGGIKTKVWQVPQGQAEKIMTKAGSGILRGMSEPGLITEDDPF